MVADSGKKKKTAKAQQMYHGMLPFFSVSFFSSLRISSGSLRQRDPFLTPVSVITPFFIAMAQLGWPPRRRLWQLNFNSTLDISIIDSPVVPRRGGSDNSNSCYPLQTLARQSRYDITPCEPQASFR